MESNVQQPLSNVFFRHASTGPYSVQGRELFFPAPLSTGAIIRILNDIIDSICLMIIDFFIFIMDHTFDVLVYS